MNPLQHEVAGEGPAVVLLHAGVCDRRMWGANAAALGRGRRLVTLDLRGFGGSQWGAGPYSHADDVVGLLDFLAIEEAALVGASLGGRVALDIAVEHPERVAALVLAGPALGGWDWSDGVRSFGEREDELLDAGDLAGAVELNLRMWVDGRGRGPEEVDAELRAFVAAMQHQAFELAVEAYSTEPYPGPEREPDPPTASRLHGIGVPTLVLVGELDQPDLQAIAARIAEHVPAARLVTIDGASHLPSLERPDVFDELAGTFLGDKLG